MPFQNGVFLILVKNFPEKFLSKNGLGRILWKFLQPTSDRSKRRHSSLRNQSPFRFGQKHRSVWSKSLGYTNVLIKTKNLSKRVGVHSLELFAVDIRSFQKRTFFSKKWVTLSDEAQFIWADSTEGSVIRSKSFVYTKIPQKNWKFVENGSGCTL